MAENAGFEPTGLLHPLAFQASAIDHSASFPDWSTVRWIRTTDPLIMIQKLWPTELLRYINEFGLGDFFLNLFL